MDKLTLEGTYKAGLLNDERVSAWESDLQKIHAGNLPADIVTTKIVTYSLGNTMTSGLAAVGLALILDRRALLQRIRALETALVDAQVDAAVASADITLLLSDSVGHA